MDSEGRTIFIVDAHRDGKRFIVRADEKALVKGSGHTPTLPCLAYKQKWPPKKDDHSCCGKLFGAAGVF